MVASKRSTQLVLVEDTPHHGRHAAKAQGAIEMEGCDLGVPLGSREGLLGLEVADGSIVERELEGDAAPASSEFDIGERPRLQSLKRWCIR